MIFVGDTICRVTMQQTMQQRLMDHMKTVPMLVVSSLKSAHLQAILHRDGTNATYCYYSTVILS
jgi:hypothetical protein